MQSAFALLYCHLQNVWLCHTFPNYFMNGTIFEKKKMLNIKYVCFYFLYKFV